MPRDNQTKLLKTSDKEKSFKASRNKNKGK